jgi:hypothetical protein
VSALVGLLHAATIFGLLLGTLGRFGFALNQGQAITRNQVVGQLLMLGICGLLAETGNDAVALAMPGAGSDTSRALVGAGRARIASQAVSRFAKNTEAELKKRLPAPPTDQEPRP